MAGAAAGVLVACILSHVINLCRQFYSERLLKKDRGQGGENGRLSDGIYWFMRCSVKLYARLGLNRESEIQKLQMEKKLTDQHEELNDPSHPRDAIDLDWETEDLFLETIVGSQDINIWSILMPAVYQLVPGSIIAKFWFHSIFLPEATQDDQENVFSNLMVISASLALGLIFGFALVQTLGFVAGRLHGACCKEDEERAALRKRRQTTMDGMYTTGTSGDDDPRSPLPPSGGSRWKRRDAQE